MFWDEELESTQEKKDIKTGRRAGLSKQNTKDPKDTSNNESEPPTVRKTGGWADETVKGKIFQNKPIKNDLVDHIQLIPDIDDAQDGTSPPAAAPIVPTDRTTTYTEINKDLMKNSMIPSMGSSNFSILSEQLQVEDNLHLLLEDTEWKMDDLFKELSEDYYKRLSK